MTLFIDLSDEELEKILLGDRGMDLLMEKVLNQILQAEMTDHLGAGRYERSEERTSYRNGSYERKLTTRVGTIELEVPRDREGTVQTALFRRYQQTERFVAEPQEGEEPADGETETKRRYLISGLEADAEKSLRPPVPRTRKSGRERPDRPAGHPQREWGVGRVPQPQDSAPARVGLRGG